MTRERLRIELARLFAIILGALAGTLLGLRERRKRR